jgi:hypothetical protein
MFKSFTLQRANLKLSGKTVCESRSYECDWHYLCTYPAWETKSGIQQNVHKSKAVTVRFLDHCNHDKEWTTIYMTMTKTASPVLEAGYN